MRAIVVLGALVACKSERAAPVPSPAPADPWGGSAAPPPPETPAEKRRRADVALARVAQIMPKLAALRELTFDHDIPRQYQSTDDFRTFVRAEIAKDLPKARSADLSAALHHVGLMPKPGDLAELEERAFTTQAGAYYDPTTKRFFLVMVPEGDLILDTISAHELTHGLQDQHFDLDRFMPGGDALDADQQAARRFVAEGDATFTMFLYAIAQMGGGKASPEMVKLLRAQIDQFSTMTPTEMLKQNVLGLGASLDPELAQSMEAIHDIPLTVLVPMFDSYLQGAQVVATAYERGGWKAVDELYRDPPESTEQVLHPATKLYPRDHPKRVTLAKPTEGAEIASLVFGELQWQIYFALWSPTRKGVASEGWGGDRVSVTRRGDGRLVARLATVWDSAQDAEELALGYTASLAIRFPKGAGAPASPAGFDRGDGAGRIFLARRGPKVFIVDGADAAGALAELVETTRIE